MQFGLQFEITAFVDEYAPKSTAARGRFIQKLRILMNEYARSAIAHGDIPEVGVPHKPLEKGRRLTPAAGKSNEGGVVA